MTENIPVPQIPRIDNEKKLEGAPQSAEDSLFLTFPGLAKTANILTDFNKAKSKQAAEILSKTSEEFLRDPQKIAEVFDALHLLEEAEGYQGKNFESRLLARIEKSGTSASMTPEVAGKWLELSIESNLYGDIADKVLKNTIEKCTDRTSLVKLLYNLVLGGIKSGNDDVVDKTLETLSLQNDIFNPHSKQGINYILAYSDTENEDNLKKILEIDTAIDHHTVRYIPELYKKKQEKIGEVIDSPAFLEESRKITGQNPDKIQKLKEYYKSFNSSSIGIIEIDDSKPERTNDFPYNLVTQNPGPLREWINEKIRLELSQKNGKNYLNMSTPGFEGIREIEGDLARNIAEIIKNCDKNSENISGEKYWRTLALMVPPEARDKETLGELRKLNQEIKEEIKNNSRSLLSPRGDEIKVTDELLKGYGFNSILYEMNPGDKRETVVTVDVSGIKYKILLDEYLAFKNPKSRESMNLPDESVFIKNVILSHLRELKCSEKVYELENGEVGKKYGENARKAFISRRAHRRILPEGHNPTKQQISSIMEVYGIDIIRINKERESMGQDRRVTYVFEVENVALGGDKPIRSHTPEATNKLKEILKNNHNNQEKKN